MRLYSATKPPSPINSDWIYWTNKSHFKNIEADSNQISALLFITRNKEIEIIYKPTPIINDANDQFEGIMGNMFNDGSTPAIIKIDDDDIGACTTIQVFPDLPERFARNSLSSRILSRTQNGKRPRRNLPSSSFQPWLPSRTARTSNQPNLTMTSSTKCKSYHPSTDSGPK